MLNLFSYIIRTVTTFSFDSSIPPYIIFFPLLTSLLESLQHLGVIPQPRNPDIEIQQTPEQLEQEIKRLAVSFRFTKCLPASIFFGY